MKKIIILVFVISSMATYAQHQAKRGSFMKDFTPEQTAILKTKKMALALDLSDAQQNQMLDLNKKWAAEHQKQREAMKTLKKEEMSATDKFNLMNSMLDMQLAHQKQIKKILNEDQFTVWQKTKKNKGMWHSEMRKQHHGKNQKKM